MLKKSMSAVMACALLSCLFAAESKPVMRVAVISDTHVKETPQSAFLVGEAYKLFRSLNVDVVINCGDIGDHYNEKAYKHYRNAVKAAYGENKLPVEFFAYANHDILRRNRKDGVDKIFADVRKHLNIFHAPESITKLNGYNFVTVRQGIGEKQFTELIDKAVKDTPDKPVFLIDHMPAYDTVWDSDTWGSWWRRKVLERYPQVIQFSGHIHGTLANELNIWQGKFTAVNAGGLAYWHAVLMGNVVATRYSDMALVMDVYKDKLVMRRYFTKSKTEYQKDTPWVVTLPYKPENAIYSPEKRKAASVAPEFVKGSRVKVTVEKDGAVINFPRAQHKDGVFYYKQELFRKENGKWVRFSRRDIMGDFDLDPRPEMVESFINIGYFDAGKEYKVAITPVHAFGKAGKAIEGEFAVKDTDTGSTVVFESRNPMKDCPFLLGLNKNTPVPKDKDGYYDFNGYGRIVFPDEIWKGDTYTQFRITVEMHAKQGKTRWTLTMRNIKPTSNGNNRFYTEPGDNGVQRYVFDMYKSRPSYKYCLLIREGSPGKVRFDYIKIERLKEPFRRGKKHR
ncbi:MAG: metallophosphoesterase [Lentisphaeria bacterium]|nr:metallophosphoesterase [Lentisphaeria bacterium]